MSKQVSQEDILEKAANIKLLVLDVDGVLTDGQLIFSNSGEEMKAFSTLDGQGIKMLGNNGVEVAIITGRKSQLVANRAANIGIKHVIQGREDKLDAMDELLLTLQVSHEETAFVGDDWPDLSCIRKVGLGITVPDGHPELIKHAFCVTTRKGGYGAVREVCDWILKGRGSYQKALNEWL